MKVLVFLEQRDNKLKNSALEALTLARKLADSANDVSAILIGEGISPLVEKIKGYGASKVYLADHSALGGYNALNYCAALQEAIVQSGAELVLAPATPMGRDIMPRLAARNDSGIITDAVDIENRSGTLVALKPMYAGKCLAETTIENSKLKFISIRPNTIIASPSGDGEATIQNLSLNQESPLPLKTTGIRKGEGSDKVDLTEASIIISGGRAIGSADNFKMIEECAAVIGAAVGASRAAVDAGYRPHSAQVGQTGKTVSPNLYIACGISGAIQHLAGMRTSKNILAINNDPDAPIFSICDYGIVGDIFEIVPLFTAKFKSLL
jgi:electron transfer flavoprotein alpha subunit